MICRICLPIALPIQPSIYTNIAHAYWIENRTNHTTHWIDMDGFSTKCAIKFQLFAPSSVRETWTCLYARWFACVCVCVRNCVTGSPIKPASAQYEELVQWSRWKERHNLVLATHKTRFNSHSLFGWHNAQWSEWNIWYIHTRTYRSRNRQRQRIINALSDTRCVCPCII